MSSLHISIPFTMIYILLGSEISKDEACNVLSVLASSGMTSGSWVVKECSPQWSKSLAELIKQSHPPVNLCPGFRMSFTFPLVVLILWNNLVLVVVMRAEDGELTGSICSCAKSSFSPNHRLGRMRSADKCSQWGEGKRFPGTKGRGVEVNKLILSRTYAPSPPFPCNLGVMVVLIIKGRQYNAEQRLEFSYLIII